MEKWKTTQSTRKAGTPVQNHGPNLQFHNYRRPLKFQNLWLKPSLFPNQRTSNLAFFLFFLLSVFLLLWNTGRLSETSTGRSGRSGDRSGRRFQPEVGAPRLRFSCFQISFPTSAFGLVRFVFWSAFRRGVRVCRKSRVLSGSEVGVLKCCLRFCVVRRPVAEKTEGKGNERKSRYLTVYFGFLLLWLFPRKRGRWWTPVRQIAGLGTVESAFLLQRKS